MTAAYVTGFAASPALPTRVGAPRTQATFRGNRWPHSPAGRVDHSVRIAFVGDSMVYGHGVPFTQTLAPRVARHLNVARPGLWFDCQTFGLPGACAFHALARAESHAAPLAPDVLVIALTQNDAYMLRRQPYAKADVGQTWVDFAPILATAFADFRARWQRAGRLLQVAVLYFDRYAQLGETRPADVLRPICEAQGFLFVDGAEPLAGMPHQQIEVSSHDGHLNGTGHDIVARHLARALLAEGWIPEAPGYDDLSWLGRCETAGARLVNAGVPPAPAASEALSVLRLKWHDRRNRARMTSAHAFQAIERRLLQSVREQWQQVALRAYQQNLDQQPSFAVQIFDVEDHIYRARTLNLALQHAVLTGSLQQPTAGLICRSETSRGAGLDVATMAERAGARSARALAMLDAIPCDAGQLDIYGLRGLAVLAERLRLANTAAALGLMDLAGLVPQLPAHPTVNAVVKDAIETWQIVDATLGSADRRTGWPDMAAKLQHFAPDRPTMTLHLTMVASAGTAPWVFRLGADSPLHAVSEGFLASANLIRDGQPHTYLIELPLMLASTISVSVSGEGIDSDQASGQLRISPARIEVPSLPEPVICKPTRIMRHSETAIVIEYVPFLFARPE